MIRSEQPSASDEDESQALLPPAPDHYAEPDFEPAVVDGQGAPLEPHAAVLDQEVKSGPVAPLVLLALLVLLQRMAGWPAVVVVLGFVFMIFMHELGHYLTAKSAGMKVTQFFIGFGPKLWSFRRGETEYGIKALPLGAYVRIVGMNNLDPVEVQDRSRAYIGAPYWRRMSVVLAGSAMHFAMAFVGLVFLHSVVGFTGPTEPEAWFVDAVTADSSAAAMGFEAGDEVLTVAGHEIQSFGELVGIIHDSGGQVVEFGIVRDGAALVLAGEVGSHIVDEEQVGQLGIRRGFVDPPRESLVSSLGTSTNDFVEFTRTSVGGVVGLPRFLMQELGLIEEQVAIVDGVEQTGGGQVIGAIGMVRAGDDIVDSGGWRQLGMLWAAVNVFVGIFNLIPLLPFDGGHAAIATYERIRGVFAGRRHVADVGKLLPLTYATLAVLFVLMMITFKADIFDFEL